MVNTVPGERIAAVRAFNRDYATFLADLDEHLLGSPYSLTEARVLAELGQRELTEVTDLRRRTGLDAGYLSRLLARFGEAGLLTVERSTADARRRLVRLSPAGREAHRMLDDRSAQRIRTLLTDLTDDEQTQLVEAMDVVRRKLVDPDVRPRVVLRAPKPGDCGWVVERNGVLYAHEHDWNSDYEGLVAGIVAGYLAGPDPYREAAWIAELRGERVGAVFCVRADDTTALLRLLHVEPGARGAGVGTALVDECVRFARQAGYRQLRLWTVGGLAPAGRIYRRAGFRLVAQETADHFGHRLEGQTWVLDL